MSKHINQTNFNELVLENKELFGLDWDEAFYVTVDELSNDGYDVDHIIRDEMILKKENLCTKVVNDLEHACYNDDDLSPCLDELETLFKKGCDYKVMCGKPVCQILMEKLASETTLNNQETILKFFTVLFDGYPDLLDKKGCALFLKMFESAPQIQKLLFKIIDLTCMKHELNRQLYIENNMIHEIKKLICNQPSKESLCELINILPAMTRDDDIRVETSKRYIHACSLSEELLIPLCELIKAEEIEEPNLVDSLLKAFSAIVVNNDQCAIFESEQCLPILMNFTKKFRKNEKILVKCFTFFFGLAGNDEVNIKIIKANIAPELTLAMNNYINNKNIVLMCLKLVSRLCLRKPVHGKVFFAIEFPTVLIQSMKVHKTNDSIQVAGCWCIRNMTCRNHAYRKDFLVLGAEGILKKIIEDFKEHSRDAKFALIELGCKVKLNEPWTGKEGDKLKRN